jgi:SulP family sulfate permease
MVIGSSYLRQWLFNPRIEFLSGIIVALALIPEAIGFSVIAGVDPKIGLYASVIIVCVSAFTGGRPAMISAATASTSVLMTGIVHVHGVQYLFAATLLMGALQIIAGILKLSRLMKFVSLSVTTGFVNAVAILILLAQAPQLTHVSDATYGMIILALAIIYGLPYVTKSVPSPLVAISVLTIITAMFHPNVHTVENLGQFPSSFPRFALPGVPLNFETLQIIAPVSLALATVGLLESLLTAQIIDEMTDTTSQKNQECASQGMANIISALFGGMGGCAMIGQSAINVSSGGRGRISTLAAGLSLIVLLVFLQRLLTIIPVAALTAVMIMVSINTFSWRSFVQLRKTPWQSSAVMLATVGIALVTGDLSKAVLSGVLLSGIFFAGKIGRLTRCISELSSDRRVRTYYCQGQIFFVVASTFVDSIDVVEDLDKIIIDFTSANLSDVSAVAAFDRVLMNARRHHRELEIVGLNAWSQTMVERFSRYHRIKGAIASFQLSNR